MRARWTLLPVALLALAACTGDPRTQRNATTEAKAWGETLLLQTENGPVSVSAATGSPLLSGVGGVASADGTRVYTTERSGRFTLLRTLEAASGAVIGDVHVPGRFEVSIVAPSGMQAALIEPLPPGIELWTPIPRSRTTIVVADPTGASEPRTYELNGNYEPEAFSTEGDRLFLIQHLPAEAPSVYRVTVMNLARGRVSQVFGPFKVPPERMPGTRLEQAASPDGRFLFTLYSTERPDYGHLGIAHHGHDSVISFIHVLSLEEGWAHCFGLPKAFWDRPAEMQAMAVSPDGRELYVVDTGLGQMATLDTESLEFSDALRVIEPVASAPASITAAPDGTVFIGAGDLLTAIDGASNERVGSWRASGPISGLTLSEGGERLFAVLDGRIDVLDAGTTEELGATTMPSLGSILSVAAIG
jgi:hypothetical protein